MKAGAERFPLLAGGLVEKKPFQERKEIALGRGESYNHESEPARPELLNSLLVTVMGFSFLSESRSLCIMLLSKRFAIAGPLLILLFAGVLSGQEKPSAKELAELDATVIPAEKAKEMQLPQMLSRDVRERIRAANDRETEAWRAIKTKADWEDYRDARIQKLRDSLGQFPKVPADLKVKVTGNLRGDGYRIENLVYESRPGLLVTANLYLPAEPPKSMPGILIIHSHHNPKTQSELQDMGMTWARLGCLVLVMDQLGHGERRQHPFLNEKSYPGTFRPTRQDYYFRYNTANQLHLVGESLMGWMAWDLMRGVDLLLARPGIDKEKILLFGSVAGGGDPAGVTAAIDPRITAVAPFNFGGPQPETIFPLPADAEKAFNYAGGGSWESTRNLRLSARDGFQPWVIVGSVSPRRLIYGHEFAWDRERDPVWARFEKIWDFYSVKDSLAAAQGRGKLSGKPPESTHCNNIGPEHRKPMYPTLKKWFDMPEPDKEFQTRRVSDELLCLTPESGIKAKPLHELADELGNARLSEARGRRAGAPLEFYRQRLRRDWNRLLGAVIPTAELKVWPATAQKVEDVTVEKIVLEVEPQIVVPMLLLIPPRKADAKVPVVIGLAQHGKQEFLKQRPLMIEELLRGGVAVCLPDLRGTGETRPGDSRGRSSSSTSISSSELMLGQTLVGARLRDLRSVMQYLRGRTEMNANRMVLWGDSFAPVNPADRNLAVPLDAEKMPDQAEPLGGMLALFAPLFEDKIHAVYINAGLTSFTSALQGQFPYLPHDVMVPGALTVSDLVDLAAAVAPRPLRMEGLVDGSNRRAPMASVEKLYEPVAKMYQANKLPTRFSVVEGDGKPGAAAAQWILAQIKEK